LSLEFCGDPLEKVLHFHAGVGNRRGELLSQLDVLSVVDQSTTLFQQRFWLQNFRRMWMINNSVGFEKVSQLAKRILCLMRQ